MIHEEEKMFNSYEEAVEKDLNWAVFEFPKNSKNYFTFHFCGKCAKEAYFRKTEEVDGVTTCTFCKKLMSEKTLEVINKFIEKKENGKQTESKPQTTLADLVQPGTNEKSAS